MAVYVRVVGVGFYELSDEEFDELMRIARSSGDVEEVLERITRYIVERGRVIRNPLMIEAGADYVVIPDPKVVKRILEAVEGS